MNKSKRKGIILAGGTGSRLYPLTKAISKQLAPVYDKPMIYYPLTTLMLSGIKEILIITNKSDINSFKNLLGNGKHLGINIEFEIQNKPNGLAEAFVIGNDFLNGSPAALILGDNLFHGDQLLIKLMKNVSESGATIFAYSVNNPKDYGVAEFDNNKKVINIEEKPKKPKSKWAITGLYFYDKTVIDRVKLLSPSKRGELEISDLNNLYLKDNLLNVELMGRGIAWFDTGNCDSLLDASSYIRTLEKIQGLKIGCPEEVAWRLGYIDDQQLKNIAKELIKSSYGKYLNNYIEKL